MRMRNETDYKTVLFRELARYFNVQPEATVMHVFGQRLRVDAILRPKFLPWKGIIIGLEVKAFEFRKDVSINQYTAALKQSIDYSLCYFDGQLLDLVLLHPGIFRAATHASILEDNAIYIGTRLAGQFRVGELIKSKYCGWEIRINDVPLWRANQGLTEVGKTFRWKRGNNSAEVVVGTTAYLRGQGGAANGS
jgi:hypothetical protein